MSKRKKNKKRSHKRNSVGAAAGKAVSPTVSATSATTVEPAAPITTQFPAASSKPTQKPAASQPLAAQNTAVGQAAAAEWVFVRSDVRRIGILAAVCIGLQLVLAYLFSHTGLGDTVYSLIKL